jgi:hypothetical protein
VIATRWSERSATKGAARAGPASSRTLTKTGARTGAKMVETRLNG